MNFLAIAITALVPMVLGFIWYNPKVFGGIWMRETGLTEEQTRQGNLAVKLGLSLLFSVMLAMGLNGIVVHDGFIQGAMYYKTNRTMIPEAGSEMEKWYNYYKTNLAADNHIFTHGAFHGFFLIGLFALMPAFATNAIFEKKSFKYVAVNVSYWLLCVTIMGGILAVWR